MNNNLTDTRNLPAAADTFQGIDKYFLCSEQKQ